MGDSSRRVDLGAGQVRDATRNNATRFESRNAARAGTPREAFIHAYARIRGVALAFDQLGVGVFAVELQTGQYLGALGLPSRDGALQTGVLGRHSQCPLLIEHDPALALRQLLCVVEPPDAVGEIRGRVRFRLLDLGTTSPPVDEDNRVLASLTAEGPVVLRLGRIAVFALPTGDPTDWPERDLDAWDCLPERIYFDERLAEGSAPHVLPRPNLRHTLVARREPVLAELPARLDDGPAIGHLHIHADGRATRFPISATALRRGVLVGRYARCQAGALAFGDDDTVSRVHAILLDIDGAPWLIDTASSKGLWLRDKQRDAIRLSTDSPATLGPDDGDATIQWEPT